MKFKDFYSILGISNNASATEVKKAFHKLAIQYHPDKNPDDPLACDKFKLISEAYEVLSNPLKRSLFDKISARYYYTKNYSKTDTSYYRNNRPKNAYYQKAYATEYNSKGSNFNSPISDFYSSPYFSKASSSANYTYQTIVHLSLEDVFCGTNKNLMFHGIKVPLKISPGIGDGKIISIRNFKSFERENAHKSSIDVIVKVDKHKYFIRENSNLFYNLNISIYKAILGGKEIVPTIDGKSIKLTIPSNTNNGTVFKVKGFGLPYYDNNDVRGDLYIKAQLHLPPNMTDKELAIFRYLAQLQTNNSPN